MYLPTQNKPDLILGTEEKLATPPGDHDLLWIPFILTILMKGQTMIISRKIFSILTIGSDKYRCMRDSGHVPMMAMFFNG